MPTNVKQITPVDFELEVHTPAETMQPRIDAALRAQRGQVQLKGFRPGKVPMEIVRKMFGKAVAFEIAEKEVQDVFEEEVLDNPAYKLLGRPSLTEITYEGEGDLRATVRFGVRPEVELQDLSNVTLTKLAHGVTDEEVEEELTGLRRRIATMEEAGDETITEDHHVTIDLQPLDDSTGTPLIGQGEKDVDFFVNDPNLKTELHDAILGKKEGDTAEVTMTHEEAHGDHTHAHSHRYRVTVKKVQRQNLPELDDDFAKKATNDRIETLDGLRDEIRAELEKSWTQRSRDYMETQIVEKLSEMHPVPVPDSAVELYLDSFVESVKERNKGTLPPGFDERGFRERSRGEAERQARWMVIRDHLIETEGIRVEDEDLDRYFASQAQGLDPALFRRYYESVPRLMEQLEQRLLSEKLFARIGERFAVEEKDMEAVQAEMEARRSEPTEA